MENVIAIYRHKKQLYYGTIHVAFIALSPIRIGDRLAVAGSPKLEATRNSTANEVNAIVDYHDVERYCATPSNSRFVVPHPRFLLGVA